MKSGKTVADSIQVTPEMLYDWIAKGFDKMKNDEGKKIITNAWKGCGYFD